MERIVNKVGAIALTKFTQSYAEFQNEAMQAELLVVLLHIGGDYIEENKDDARNTVFEMFKTLAGDENYQIIEEMSESGRIDTILDIETYEHFYGQMCYARSIDNVNAYFKDILGEVILKQPNILKSKEEESLDFILKYDSMEELRIALAEKKIEKLFYGGTDEIEDFFKKRLGISLFKDSDSKNEFNQVVKNRNIIVHNRSKVNKEYLKEFPNSSLQEGEIIKFSYVDISRLNLYLGNLVAYLDNEIAEKFKLDLKEVQVK